MKKSFPYILAACSALALVGCGSDSDDDDNGNPDPGTPVVETPSSIALSLVGRYSTGQFDESAAEIPAYDAASQRLFVVNAEKGMIDVLDMSDPAAPVFIDTLDGGSVVTDGEVNSVAVHDGLVALAIEADTKTDNGAIALFNAADLSLISSVAVGAQPDMVTFTPDGNYVLAANEGEPSDDYQVDPEGSIAVIDVSDNANPVVATADFNAFNGDKASLVADGVRIFGPGASVAQDLEPEYIAVSSDSATAWAVLQENNAIARIDIASATVESIASLGYKDHGVEANNFSSGNLMDVSDEGTVEVKAWPGVRGLYLPDAMASYEVEGTTYLVTANEGDARAWGEDDDDYWAGDASKGFVEEFRVKHLVHSDGFDRRADDDLPPQLRELAAGGLLNHDTFAYCGAEAGDAGDCRDDEVLGRLGITWTMGYRQNADGTPVMFDADGNEDAAGDRMMYDNLYSYGARSFSIWDEDGGLIWDSGDMMEQYLAGDDCMLGSARDIPCKDFFNSAHDEGDQLDSRSDAKGPEPEGVALGTIGDKTLAFIGLERMGGIMVFDITDPEVPAFMDYFNTRDDWMTEDAESVLDTIGDLGPEGLVFISAEDSPTDEALLVVGFEVSGTTVVYQIDQMFE
ncbi:choice-of-anchor I family protein [Gilvimarinus sp. 1_MG-2023]|uniref:choice-of-anchor I family protein n=1 Tax=Gilvimarinus sp. 1_MG-2023 TaxID=3062638 RepID=UPI0026E1A094|nr:choice-of-anchor I family protein [Gilvimarinus sp. 1_MG-2023]MDO6746403.1 choice-of-anchor I family protein [Gilvimarinus sp. 1_MG-2023]